MMHIGTEDGKRMRRIHMNAQTSFWNGIYIHIYVQTQTFQVENNFFLFHINVKHKDKENQKYKL